ncbi:NAD(P)-dependent oxidoreductase [Rathayibacter toxicus]|uniref:NAD(P)-dependent oxidoreductase n=1 Tax=Rathayibacter toxicus TaxID=145458 RepID=UPI001C0449E5|nr:NAD(P)-dependent oxidoreductase [Rathayibacter toxicus]QWL30386.1 hydroxyacid dehydrogenase [Rathayibacter toxicus]QWL32496.1 hydroxyacid dehydrogenase [Rathayibacter toxicus]QWL34590.1 hydroxyacid dehydrogenase [Rathayibacter toxicus]QWL36722.1 hydroxyacid dehydrogenase [Rathayibacter toxicus]QWL38812.1 hydroxyacid dehydrogenase [Rathayibacter toxicus]
MSAPRIAVFPRPQQIFSDAVAAGGGVVVGLDDEPEALLWLSSGRSEELAAVLVRNPGLRWVQLPWAGVDVFASVFASAPPALVWTSAKGAYAEPVAEHALALTLALLRSLPERARASSWGQTKARTLYRSRVVIVGAGGVAQELLRLLSVFDAQVTIVRRSARPLAGAEHTVTATELPDVVADADVLVLAAAAVGGTAHLVDAALFDRLPSQAVLVNVARGSLVDTDALVTALAVGRLAGAALDVTDPEPLPDKHPLWKEPRCLITPHTANPLEIASPLLAERVRTNVAAFAAGKPLTGVVDPAVGY